MNRKTIAKQVMKAMDRAIAICGSQAKLAEAAGITQGYVSHIKRGERIPNGPTAKRLSKAVGGVMDKSEFAPHIYDSTP